MSLQQECIDMFKLIVSGRSEYEDIEIEENTGVFLCKNREYKNADTLSDCEEECQPLTSHNCMEFVKVDLIIYVPWWSGDSDCGYICINFNKKPEKEHYYNSIHYINDREQLTGFMSNLKSRVGKRIREYTSYVKKVDELKVYGHKFLLQVQHDFPVFSDINCELPMVFSDFAKDDEGMCKYEVGGDFKVNDNVQLIIHIYDCWRDIDVLKMTVRHEIIHYILYLIGTNYEDDCGVFHYFCKKYDAHAYIEMSLDQQKVYDFLLAQTNEDVNNMLVKIKKRAQIVFL